MPKNVLAEEEEESLIMRGVRRRIVVNDEHLADIPASMSGRSLIALFGADGYLMA